jgi:acetate kinase
MSEQRIRRILTINTGSSSLKAALYDLGTEERLGVQAVVERIGFSESTLRINDASGATLLQELPRL